MVSLNTGNMYCFSSKISSCVAPEARSCLSNGKECSPAQPEKRELYSSPPVHASAGLGELDDIQTTGLTSRQVSPTVRQEPLMIPPYKSQNLGSYGLPCEWVTTEEVLPWQEGVFPYSDTDHSGICYPSTYSEGYAYVPRSERGDEAWEESDISPHPRSPFEYGQVKSPGCRGRPEESDVRRMRYSMAESNLSSGDFHTADFQPSETESPWESPSLPPTTLGQPIIPSDFPSFDRGIKARSNSEPGAPMWYFAAPKAGNSIFPSCYDVEKGEEASLYSDEKLHGTSESSTGPIRISSTSRALQSRNVRDAMNPISKSRKEICQVCSREIAVNPSGKSKSNLLRHMKQHGPDRATQSIRCENAYQGCTSTFTRKDNMKSHLKKGRCCKYGRKDYEYEAAARSYLPGSSSVPTQWKP